VKTYRHNATVHWGNTDPEFRRTRGHTPLYIPQFCFSKRAGS
jgi:hypothetical protein